ncbi:aldehyde reductase [bacterium]|nr:aldehyde reductase [bacterium]MCB2179060.1 aldehyde reductase [bacterium]
MNNANQNTLVLVTGATGFLASRCVLQLLNAGYRVRGTIRSLEKATAFKNSLAPYTDRLDALSLVRADLLQDKGWDQAVADCTYVLHVASPFPLTIPKDEDDLIRPAVEGTRRVLGAAARAGVKRVVQTSSIAAVSAAYPDQNRTFTEADWSLLDGDIEPYPKSKTLAEKAAWEFVESLPPEQSLELAVINPGYILGPVINDRQPSSVVLHQTLMNGNLPGVARIKYNIVDVRDVAQAHLAAMTTPEAAGKRFVCVGAGLFLPEIVRILDAHFKPQGFRIPTRTLPTWVVRLAGLFNPVIRDNAKGVGEDPIFDTTRIRTVLNWTPLPAEQTLVEMGESLIAHGVIQKP